MKAQSDVQAETSTFFSNLDWVGMSQIQTAVQFQALAELQFLVPALLDVGVDLAENNRGIHMSRLYQLHQELILNQALNFAQLSRFASASLASQAGLSQKFGCKVSLAWPQKTLSLKSELPGFRNYAVQIIFEKDPAHENVWVQFEVIYSSTCPQSASLSMEILKDHLIESSAPLARLPATPHAQRSRAVIQVQLESFDEARISALILRAENALGTPVQTSVKKADEMRFAEVNAENLMFCEDAARRLSQAFAGYSGVRGVSIYCEHLESLHPHNASSLKRHHFQPPQRMAFSN